MRTATCSDCRQPFPVEYLRGRLPDRCEPCKVTHDRRRGQSRTAAYRERHPDRVIDSRRRAPRRDPAKRRVSALRTYGLTVEQFDALVDQQRGLCGLCGNPPAGRGRGSRLHVDHDHQTGRVRGLLCGKCNTLIGLADESVDTLLAAIRYLGGTDG